MRLGEDANGQLSRQIDGLKEVSTTSMKKIGVDWKETNSKKELREEQMLGKGTR